MTIANAVEIEEIRSEARTGALKHAMWNAERAGNCALALAARVTLLEDELHVTREQLRALAPPPDDFGCLTAFQARFLGAMIAAGKDRVLSRFGLMVAVYHGKPEADWPAPNVIDTHICHIRSRLARAGVPITIETIRDRGYRVVHVENHEEGSCATC